MTKMRPPKVGEPQVPVLTVDEIGLLFAACQGQDFEARRDMAILRILATCGLRRAEIAGLRYVPDKPLEKMWTSTGASSGCLEKASGAGLSALILAP